MHSTKWHLPAGRIVPGWGCRERIHSPSWHKSLLVPEQQGNASQLAAPPRAEGVGISETGEDKAPKV